MAESSLLLKIVALGTELCGGVKNASSYVVGALSIVAEGVPAELQGAEFDRLKEMVAAITSSPAELADNLRRDVTGKFDFDDISLFYAATTSLGGRSQDLTADALFAYIVNDPPASIKRTLGGGVNVAEAASATRSTNSARNISGLEELTRRVKTAQSKLLKIVFGQDQAINAFVSGYFQAELISLTGKPHNGPKATFLFAGPSGVGKTFLADNAAHELAVPYMRFDMSEYADHEANLQFAGSSGIYKDSHPGYVTGFVQDNPNSILLFDEIEKANLSVIHLFLQILDAGRLRDNNTNKEVDFSNTVLIFTTNAGRKVYENPDNDPLSSVPRKQILEALATEKDGNGMPLMPASIVSRFASGNVLMFNRMEAHTLLRIAQNEFDFFAKTLNEKLGLRVTYTANVLYSLLFSEVAKVDARTIRGKTSNFFSQETYELLRLLTAKKGVGMANLEEIHFDVELPQDAKIRGLYDSLQNPNVLVFSDNEAICQKAKADGLVVHFAHEIGAAKTILFNHTVTAVFCDIKCGLKETRQGVLNIEDADSEGINFLHYMVDNLHIPVYLISMEEGDISAEEELSFVRRGARGRVFVNGEEGYNLPAVLADKCNIAYQQNKLSELARANKVLSFQTAQSVSADGRIATITLFGLSLALAPDSDDSQHLNAASSVRFSDIIGAKDAKGELAYFVEYFKDPIGFMRRGVRAPKGILLYGPPGTGKTMLAKAMANEAGVTFIAAEGNEFLKKYMGEGPQKVHDYFAMARRYAPAVLFVDEIDAIGKNRDNSEVAQHTADVLTAFLTEMDGFHTQSDKPVFVMAATNVSLDDGKSALDPALLRRFDRRILVDLPTKPDREQFIRYKLAKTNLVSLSEEQIRNIAMRSTGMSLADLDSVFELAMRNAIKSHNNVVDDACFEDAFEQYHYGDVKKWDNAELLGTARHEAGHALLYWLGGQNPSFVTVVARGNFGGYMQHADNEDKGKYTRQELLYLIRVSLGGRAAEVVYYGEEEGVSTGASSDLEHATQLALSMITRYGMDDLGLGTFGLDSADPEYAAQIRARVNQILQQEYANAKQLIADNRKAIDALVAALLEKNQLKEEEIDAIFSANATR